MRAFWQRGVIVEAIRLMRGRQSCQITESVALVKLRGIARPSRILAGMFPRPRLGNSGFHGFKPYLCVMRGLESSLRVSGA